MLADRPAPVYLLSNRKISGKSACPKTSHQIAPVVLYYRPRSSNDVYQSWIVADGSRSGTPERAEDFPPVADVRDEFTRMWLFVGEKQAEKYVRLYLKYEDKGHVMGWNWAAFLFGPIWLFYRKLNLEGMLLILIPVLLWLIHSYAIAGALVIYVPLYIFANQYYLYRAEREIYAIEKTGLPSDERDHLIQIRGGGSMRGALAGLLIMTSLIGGVLFGPTWSHLDSLKVDLNLNFLKGAFQGGFKVPQLSNAKLPTCTSPRIKKMVRKMVMDQLKTLNIPSVGVETKDFSQVSATRIERNCKMTMSGAGQSGAYKIRMYWRDVGKKRFGLQLAPM
jgi:hypothetical protein